VSQVVDNTAGRRFELEEAGSLAFADYRREAGTLEGRRVIPLCSYASAYIRRHPEHHDLMA
jgi:hypothetical protein